jgi:hypothetical protein
MAKNKWIQDAIKHPGALTQKAKAAHMSLASFEAHPPKGVSDKTKREIALAKTLKGFNHPHMGTG